MNNVEAYRVISVLDEALAALRQARASCQNHFHAPLHDIDGSHYCIGGGVRVLCRVNLAPPPPCRIVAPLNETTIEMPLDEDAVGDEVLDAWDNHR